MTIAVKMQKISGVVLLLLQASMLHPVLAPLLVHGTDYVVGLVVLEEEGWNLLEG